MNILELKNTDKPRKRHRGFDSEWNLSGSTSADAGDVGRRGSPTTWISLDGFTVPLAKIWRLLKYCIWFSHMKRNSQGIFLCHVWLPEGSSCSFFPWFMDDMDDYDDWNANPWGSRHHEGPVELWWPPLAADLTTIADLAWSEGGHWQKAAACNMEMRTCRYWTDQQVIETG